MEEYLNLIFVTIIWFAIALYVFYLVNSYSTKNTHIFAKICTFIGWQFPISVIFLLPLDMASTKYELCLESANLGTQESCGEPLVHVKLPFILTAWRIIYWVMFLHTWLVLPIISSYWDNGYFTGWDRFKKSVKINIIFYLILGVIGGIGLAYIVISRGLSNYEQITGLCMAIANLYGLSFVIVCLAYGFVEVPRYFIRKSDRGWSLKELELKAPTIKDCLMDSETEYADLAKEAHILSNKTNSFLDSPFRKEIDIVLKSISKPLDVVSRMPESSPEFSELTLSKIAKLNISLIRASHNVERWTCEWNRLCRNAFYLQDILATESRREVSFPKSLNFTNSATKEEWKVYLKYIWGVKLASGKQVY
jgi:hypothetical protein